MYLAACFMAMKTTDRIRQHSAQIPEESPEYIHDVALPDFKRLYQRQSTALVPFEGPISKRAANVILHKLDRHIQVLEAFKDRCDKALGDNILTATKEDLGNRAAATKEHGDMHNIVNQSVRHKLLRFLEMSIELTRSNRDEIAKVIEGVSRVGGWDEVDDEAEEATMDG